MRQLQTAALLAATLCTGLMAGLFTAFAYSVMPGLGRSSDRTLVEAMQNINKAIVSPLFMVLFMGAIPLLVLVAVLSWRGQGRAALPWLIAALALYLVAFLVTSGINVPLNDRLAAAGDPDRIGQLAAVRGDFESRWVTWNIVRALLHTAAFLCLAWALLVYGGQRATDSAGGAPARPQAATAFPTASPAGPTGSPSAPPR
ncbi:DUF1772 domain-containing protein [Streptomyces sp. NPDC058045]|uniref:anthrone oxygenase family protein n=1 Tax=Streptomyces sp. NPDC058045 TaxID=3346311 RepID=UPI0036E44891